MQTLDYRCSDVTKIESFYEAIDFPTEEEWLEVLEISLPQSPRLPRATSAAVDATSRDLAQHWQNLNGQTSEPLRPEKDEHYLASWLEDPVSHRAMTVEPDFLAALITFLMERLTLRLHEISEVQGQLAKELAQLKR